jgi:simple sugar transport system permease protein
VDEFARHFAGTALYVDSGRGGRNLGRDPGILKAKFGSHEVINTIMLNFIAIALVSYFTQYYFKKPGDAIMQTVPIGEAAHIPRISQFIPGMPDFRAAQRRFILAILMCVLVYIFLWKTKWGYELRAVGENASAAEYGGISPKKQIVIAMTISGGLAGMVAIGEVMGNRYLYYHDFSAKSVFWESPSRFWEEIIRSEFS